MRNILLPALLLCSAPTLHAQAISDTATTLSPPDKQIEIIGDTITGKDAFFIGEIHDIFEGQKFEFDFVRMLHRKYGINNLVTEMGKSDAYLFNAYFQWGDTAIFTYYGRSKAVLDRLSKWQQLYNDCKITIHGIDFERETFIVAVLSIMKKNEGAQNTELYRFLGNTLTALEHENDRTSRKKHIEMYGKACELFAAEKSTLRSILKTGYTTVEEIMENPALEKKMNKRDEAMAENLLLLKKSGDGRFAVIVGAGHTAFSKGMLLKKYLSDTANMSKTTVVNMICKNCYNSSYYADVVSPLAGEFRKRDEAYMSTAFEKYQRPGYYSLINQKELTDFPEPYSPVSTYYILFKDQPKW